MSWTIAREKAGYVIWATHDLKLSPFDVLCFLDVGTPGGMDWLREQLPKTRGYFQIEGRFRTTLNDAIEEGQELMLRFDSHGAKLEVGIEIKDPVKTVVPPGKKSIETSEQYDFTVTNEIYISGE